MTTTLEVGKLEMLLKQGDFVQACTEADLRVGEFESATESGATPDANSVCLLAAATIDLGLYYSYTKSFDDGDRWLQKAEDVLNTARKLVPDNLEVQCILGRLAYERSDLRGLALFDAVLASPAAGIELKKAAFRWKSATYREAGRLDEARHAISDARTRFGPNTLEVVVEEAWLAFGERNYKGALSQFKAAMALSTDENTMAGALSCLIALGRNIEARRLFEGPAASVAPTRRMSILFSCAWALYMSNDCEEALKAFDFIIGEDSAKQYPYAYEMKADTLRRLRQYDQALNCCHEALALFPKDEGLVNEKGFVLYYSREFREALKYFDAPDVRDTPFARLYRNATLREMNRYDEATDAVSRALAESPENTDLLLEKATVFFERCKYDEAISICKGILDSNPESGDAKERLAACFRKLGKHEEARQVVEKALADCPADSDLWHELAMNYYAQGELEKAAESLLTAIKWDNTVLEYEFTLAEILNRLNRYSEALARILELKQRFPECMEVKQRCAGLLLTRHRRAEARQAFEEIPDTHSSAAALGANGLGAVLLDTREYAAAANEFQNAINICGYKEPQFLLNLAYSFLQQASVPRDYRKPPIDPVDQNLPSQPGPADLLARARSLCGEVLNLSCRNARAYQYLALIAYRAGDYREAEEYFNLACKADPTDGGYLNLGSLYAQTGMLEEAKAMFSLAEKYDRYDARLHIEMANLNLILKQPDAALTSARRAVTCDPESEDSYCALAISLMKSGDYLEAEKILRTALERLDERRSARPRLLLARILVRFGDDDKDTTRYDEALRSVCAAIRINPLEAEPHFCRGIVEFKAENYAQAYRAFEECLSLDPGRFDARRNLDIVKAKRQAEGEKSLVTRWSPLFMWGLCIVAAIMVSLCAFFGWPNAKVDKSTFTVAVPLLLGLAVVSLLLPYLSKLKLPGGFEANIVEHKKEEMISYGPKGDVGFGSSLPAVSTLLARSN